MHITCNIVNMTLQKILKLDLFPDSVFEMELKYYLTKMNKVERDDWRYHARLLTVFMTYTAMLF